MKNLILLFLLVSPFANCQIITTIAGGGIGGSGDGGPATAAKLSGPMRARPDAYGNIYIADVLNNSIRKVNDVGIITTVAGNGLAVHSGDGGPATSAGIAGAASVVVDKSGNIYIVEESFTTCCLGSWIRKINTSGIITTIAGNGLYGYSGDGGPATAAGFVDARDVIIDSIGNIFVADIYGRRIRKINTTGIITTIAGNGIQGSGGDGGPASAAELQGPTGLAIDGMGNVYVADYNKIRKIDNSGIITTVAGNDAIGFSGDGGPATIAKFNSAWGIDVDRLGNIYVADWNNARVRKIDAFGIITTIAGTGTQGYSGDGTPATSANLSNPRGVSIDNYENIYISDAANGTIRKVSGTSTGVYYPGSSKGDIGIHPNPATKKLIITSTNEITTLTINNIFGQTICTYHYISKEANIDVTDLPNGLYFVKANNTEIRKFIKQ